MESLFDFLADGIAFKLFNYDKKDAAAVKRREREDIDYSKIDADKRGKKRYISESYLYCLLSHDGDSNWTSNIIQYCFIASKQSAD